MTSQNITLLTLLLPAITIGQIMEPTENPTNTVPTAGAEHKAMEMLAKFQDPDSVLWLQAGEDKFLTLYRPALQRKASGSIVLLHAEGQHPAWPGALDYLRQRLPELGWNTLAIKLPDPQTPTPPAAPPASEAAPTEVLDETEEIFDPTTDTLSDGSLKPEQKKRPSTEVAVEAIAVERIVAASEYLKSQNNTTIIVYGQGLGALRGARYWSETGDDAVKAFIFVDAKNAIEGSDFRLTKALTNPRLPVLDIVYSRSLDAELDAKQRSEHAAITDMQAYQQHWYAEDNERLANMVYGFLRRNMTRSH